MLEIWIKKIKIKKNFNKGKSLNYLKNLPNVKINCIESTKLIGYSVTELKIIVEEYDIIIIGGGEQHLTTENFLVSHPEIKNQIEIVKIVSTCYADSKLLIGIYLGCQIIALSFRFKIIPHTKSV